MDDLYFLGDAMTKSGGDALSAKPSLLWFLSAKQKCADFFIGKSRNMLK